MYKDFYSVTVLLEKKLMREHHRKKTGLLRLDHAYYIHAPDSSMQWVKHICVNSNYVVEHWINVHTIIDVYKDTFHRNYLIYTKNVE